MNKRPWNIKDYLIPTEANAFQPHFFRFRTAAIVLALTLGVEGLFLAHTLLILPHSNYFAAIFASVLVDETNQSRDKASLRALSPNPILEKAAQLKADDMAAKGYFAHNAPDGKTPWYWFDQVGYDYAAAGENLAVNFTDSKDVTEAWLASPTHRANIMNANYTEIGIASAHGTYKGKDAIFVVQEFGRPSLIARTLPAVASTSETTLPSSITDSTKTIPKNIRVNTGSSTPVSATGAPRIIPRVENSTTTVVAGAQSEKLSIANSIAPVDAPILTTSHSGFFEQLIASPRQASTMFYLILAALLSLLFGMLLFVKIRVQHPHLIANAILLIAVALSLILLNGAFGITQAII